MSNYTAKPEPQPTESTGDVWAEIIGQRRVWTILAESFGGSIDGIAARKRVIGAMEARRNFGIEKYGTPLQRDNGRDTLNDCRDEALDLRAYAHMLPEPKRAKVVAMADALLLELWA